MHLIKTLLIAALAATTTLAAAIPDTAAVASNSLALTDPVWNHQLCNTYCLIAENICMKELGWNKEVCSDQVCTDNQVYCDCFCGEYNCPRDGGTELWCEQHGDKLKARALEENAKRQISGSAIRDFNIEKRSEIHAAEDHQKRTVEISKRVAAVDSQTANCAESCEAIVNYCINSFHRGPGDCRGDVCSDVRTDCKHCADFAKTCPRHSKRAVEVEKREAEKREIEKRIAAIESPASSCANSCNAIVNYCVNSFHRGRDDCMGDVCSDVRTDCKHCADFAKTCPK